MSKGERTTAETTTERAEERATSPDAVSSAGYGRASSSCDLNVSYAPMRTAHAGIIDRAAGTTPRYRPPRRTVPPCCRTVLIVSTGCSATVAAAAATPPDTAARINSPAASG
eukprot:scaffold12939_cov97-Isochrysis_galbana.AAC.6